MRGWRDVVYDLVSSMYNRLVPTGIMIEDIRMTYLVATRGQLFLRYETCRYAHDSGLWFSDVRMAWDMAIDTEDEEANQLRVHSLLLQTSTIVRQEARWRGRATQTR